MKQVVITTYGDQVTIAESSATSTSPGTVTVTSVQAATAVTLPAKVTLTSPPEMTLTSPATVTAGSVRAVTVFPQTVPVMSQATSVSTAVTVGSPEQVITAGLTDSCPCSCSRVVGKDSDYNHPSRKDTR